MSYSTRLNEAGQNYEEDVLCYPSVTCNVQSSVHQLPQEIFAWNEGNQRQLNIALRTHHYTNQGVSGKRREYHSGTTHISWSHNDLI